MNLVTGQGRARLLPSRKPDQLGWNLVLPFHPCLTEYIRGFKPTSIRQPTQIATFFRVLRGSIHPRIPSPSIRAHLCPSVVKKRHALCLPFRVIRVFRGSIQHHIKSVAIRGYPTPFSKHNNAPAQMELRPPPKPPVIPCVPCVPCLPWFQQHPHPSVVIGVHPWFENDHRIKPAQVELRPPTKPHPHSVSSAVPKTPGNCAEDTDFRDFPVRSSSAAAEFFPFRAVPNSENQRVRQSDT